MKNDAFIQHVMNVPPLESIRDARSVDLPASEAIVPAGAAVSGAGIIGFVEGMSQQAKDDVLDSYSYATLAADRRHSSTEEPGKWYQVFREVMTRVMHWTSQDAAYSSYSRRERVLTLDQIVMQILAKSLYAAGVGAVGAPQLLEIAGAAVEKLSEKDEPLQLFNYNSTKPLGGGRAMVGGCRESADGVIVLAVGAVELKTDLTVGNVLFFNWNSVSLDVQRNSDVFVFNQSLYARSRRQKVRDALERSADAVVELYPID
ncbi:hypothetical protein [Pseudomonas sp. NPDC088444]|uniref:hypothetical protein n=1 Tax=Pseudomonas sp. NPDC088444 TaxID=3364456 RepID=UPI003850E968